MSPTDAPSGLLEDQGENVGPFWSLLTLNPFAVQFRYDVAGEETADFEGSAQLIAQLLARVRRIIGQCGESDKRSDPHFTALSRQLVYGSMRSTVR